MEPASDALHLYQFHHDAVTVLPADCRAYATSDLCRIAGFSKDSHIFTTQAHPEFTDPFMRCVLDHTRLHLDAETAAQAEATLDSPSDGAQFAAWATRFFGGTP